jgi:hypothetical protein
MKDHSFHLDSPGQSVIERAGVLNVLYTQCQQSSLQRITCEKSPKSWSFYVPSFIRNHPSMDVLTVRLKQTR